ncbi:MAG: biotin--[Lachnospiraceae bacterium]|nr:biotin--[acetyl-CoA-carboxylase] ligase [Lachnospiraceae bacterium]
MDTKEISKCMRTQWAGRSIAFFEEIDSTNTMAKRLGEQGVPEGTLVIADCQTGGKGRRGREWFSPAGTGIWMTLLLKPRLLPDKVSAITLVAALSVCKAIRRVTGLETMIKWPNDLVMNGKKVCGILTEMSLEPDHIGYVVLGIGINVNQTEFPEELPHAWSLAMAAREAVLSVTGETGQDERTETEAGMFSREEIIARIWECFEEDYGIYLRTGDMSGLRGQYEAHLANLGCAVRVLAPSGEWAGAAEGIADSGELLVRDEAGVLRMVNSGEVSVRGVYGYT